MTLELNMFQTCALGAIVFIIGSWLVKKIAVFRQYCIPAPVVGGLLFAILHLILRQAGILEIYFEFTDGSTPTLQTVFMTIFFCSVGFTACFSMLKKGGVQVLMLLGLVVILITCQDIIGVVCSKVMGISPKLGLLMSSIPLVGGHGTAASFGPLVEESYGIAGASTVAIASATYGLVAGGIIGGPLARSHVKRLNLHSTETEAGGEGNASAGTINEGRFMHAALFLAIGIGLGTLVYNFFMSIHFTLPTYIGAMLIACLIRNIWDVKKLDFPLEEIETLGGVSLNLFLSMAMMTLKLWQLAGLALPMIIILLIQTAFMAVYAYFIVFYVMGHDYEAAAMVTASCGFGLGATPNAMANMKALTSQYGPAPRAFFIVPLVGSLFSDFFNGGIATAFMNFFN